MKHLLLIASLTGFLIFSGCFHLRPLPVNHPPATFEDEQGNSQRATLEGLGLTKSGLQYANNKTEALENALIYSEFYRQTAMAITETEYKLDDIKFYATLAGLGAGILEELDWVVGAAAIAAGSDVFKQRYNLQVQAVNYRKASEVFTCIHEELNAYEGPSNFTAKGRLKINRAMNAVVGRLETRQLEVSLELPDLNALTKQVEDSAAASREAAIKIETASRAEAQAEKSKIAAAEKAEKAVDADKGTPLQMAAENAELQKIADAEVAAQATAEAVAAQEHELAEKLTTCATNF